MRGGAPLGGRSCLSRAGEGALRVGGWGCSGGRHLEDEVVHLVALLQEHELVGPLLLRRGGGGNPESGAGGRGGGQETGVTRATQHARYPCRARQRRPAPRRSAPVQCPRLRIARPRPRPAPRHACIKGCRDPRLPTPHCACRRGLGWGMAKKWRRHRATKPSSGSPLVSQHLAAHLLREGQRRDARGLLLAAARAPWLQPPASADVGFSGLPATALTAARCHRLTVPCDAGSKDSLESCIVIGVSGSREPLPMCRQ